ncbi:type II secretion system minor pseudopilin GspI [Bordetella avium]|uniref:type II secretion system minor pseudopilin GspI n=1 Tax=Bordetella avium TaxID=521 RepID=UPI000E0A81CB|nr:type II secretion system minor pseudopilin GspI [Bordetella avium]AZY51373.1 type II secretion system protein GspI [Bordetella avium]RIQ14774.1 type II secretion system protein GspI [Bordetella avium]RIQ41237.1 type II secretion system protein GspI [Bordetella avium]RIQ45975.1 type II secretion system protein GspI [Bordetella avium]RIQ46902.1 type II secretion system protein GspI [Bordetella avium]
MTSDKSRHQQTGFSLIEVLVALAIIAIALTAALRATGLMAANHRALHNKTLALLSAQNALTQLRLEPVLPRAGKQTSACPQGGLPMRCEVTIANSLNRSFRQASVRVLGNDGAGVLIQLDGLISRIR